MDEQSPTCLVLLVPPTLHPVLLMQDKIKESKERQKVVESSLKL